VATPGLPDGPAVIVGQQAVARILKVATHQPPELLQAELISVVATHHGALAGEKAVQLFQGHSFAGHHRRLHEGGGGRCGENIRLGPEPVAAMVLGLRGRQGQAVEHHHTGGHAAVGQIRLGFKPLAQAAVIGPAGSRSHQQVLAGS